MSRSRLVAVLLATAGVTAVTMVAVLDPFGTGRSSEPFHQDVLLPRDVDIVDALVPRNLLIPSWAPSATCLTRGTSRPIARIE
jgi:hypothetical protein